MWRLWLLLVVFPVVCGAQVYRCDGPDGPVFSDRECGADAMVVELNDTTAGLGGQISVASRAALLEKRLAREQRRYVGRLYARRDEELKAIDNRIVSLRREKAGAADTLAGATYGAGIDERIAALRAARAQVETSYREVITTVQTDQVGEPRVR